MTCIMPVDTVKVRIQCAGESGGKPLSPFAVARQVMAEDGVAGLYRGLSAAWARQMVYGSSRIGLFRVLSDEAKARSGRGAWLCCAERAVGWGPGVLQRAAHFLAEFAGSRFQLPAPLPLR
jgi:solute carrier family 25 oxoglutarate transporter 11